MPGGRGEDGRPNGRMSLKSSFERSFFADIVNGDTGYAGRNKVEASTAMKRQGAGELYDGQREDRPRLHQ